MAGQFLYKVRDWNKHFENNRTRELKRLDWVPTPNKHDGDGFTELLSMPKGISLFGAWNLILQVASKCDPRGVLVRQKKNPAPTCDSDYVPHDSDSLSRVTRCPSDIMQLSLDACVKIGWLDRIFIVDNRLENPATSCGIVTDTPPMPTAGHCEQAPMEGKGMEENRREGNYCGEPPEAASPPVMVFPCVGEEKEWGLTQSKVDEYKQTFPHLDILGECRKGRQWCIDNPVQRKTFRGMPKFLSGWLGRAQDRGNGSNGHNLPNSPIGRSTAGAQEQLKRLEAVMEAKRDRA